MRKFCSKRSGSSLNKAPPSFDRWDPNMDEMAKAPNIVPKGAIRLSEAFERLYRRLTPEWNDLAERCVRWDEASLNQHEEEVDLGEDPYRVVVVSTNRAENIFRWALRDGELRAYVHNERTGIDLELNRQ